MTGTALLSLAIKPKTQADEEGLRAGLGTLMAEDPTICIKTNQGTGEVVIGAMGELHLEIIIDRLKREFNVEASVGRPQVAYKETVTQPAHGEMKYVERTSGRGEYAHAKLRLHPGKPGSGNVFENEILGGAIPAGFIRPVEEGIEEALARGVLAGYPVDDVRIVLYDGSYHDVDSSERAFKIAGAMAFADAARKAKPVLLEPVMLVRVSVPHEHTAGVTDNLADRRGRIVAQADREGVRVITARVPLAGMFGYANDLHSRTRERGSFEMQFALYQPCDPPETNDHGDDSMVGVPRKPMPTRRDSSIALPEPTEGEPEG
jgi:elongation factor G